MIEAPECANCLYPLSHPFGLIVDDAGVCGGCLTHLEKTNLDWDSRRKSLEKIVSDLPPSAERPYDCVVPIRGTPEYFYAIHVLKEELGLRVLGTIFNSQFSSSVGIRNLARIRERFDIDTLQLTIDPRKYKEAVSGSILRLGTARFPFLAGEQSFAVRTAVDYGIPLVVWPTHQPTEQVGAYSYTEAPEMNRTGWESYDLLGQTPEFLSYSGSLLSERDVAPYKYPTDDLLAGQNVRGLYLSNYFPWDSRRYSEFAVQNFSALASANFRTYDTYDRVDDLAYMGLHDLLKQKKLGYGRVTDTLSSEIRWGRIARSDAAIVRNHYQAQFPLNSLKALAEWFEIGVEQLLIPLVQDELGKGWATEVDSILESFMRRANSDDPELLPEEAKKFVGGFLVNSTPILNESKFTLIGKGLELEENLGTQVA